MATIVINQQLGSRGAELGERAANQLGYRFLARSDIVREASCAYNVDPDQFLIIDERQPHFWERSRADTERLVIFLRAVLLRLMARGRAVMVGSAPAHNLPDCGCGLRVRVIASRAARTERVASEEKLSIAAAEKRVCSHDREVRSRVRELTGLDIDDPALYHIVFNTTSLPLDPMVAALVASACQIDAHPDTSGFEQLNDAALAAQVRAALLIDPKFGHAEIKVRCTRGAVQVTGPGLVAPWDEMAERLARQIEGVHSVEVGAELPPVRYRSD